MAAGAVIGVDLGGTKLLAGAVDPALNVHHRVRRAVEGLSQAALIDAMVAAVTEVRDAVDAEVEAVGFGVPCTIDQRRGVAVMAVNLPIEGIGLRDVLAERLGLPVAVDNDANLAALAEHRFGAAQGAEVAVVLTIGTGIGGGLILGGELFRGAVGAGAELGHVVIEADGPRCQGSCPNRGCLEALASGTALVAEARRIAAGVPDSDLGRALAGGREISGPLVTELAHDGDAAARAAIATIGRRLGVGLSSFVNVFNPEVVVIGGGVMAAGELLLEPAREVVAQRALRPARDLVAIVPARFGVEAGMIGAATLAYEAIDKHAPA